MLALIHPPLPLPWWQTRETCRGSLPLQTNRLSLAPGPFMGRPASPHSHLSPCSTLVLGHARLFPVLSLCALLAVGLCTYRFSLLLFLLCPVPPKVRPLCPGSSLPQAHPQTAVGLQAAQSEALRNQEQRRPRHLAEAWLPGRREQVHPAALTVTATGLGCRRLPCRPAASLGPLPFTPRD